jgi:hypothetical protein
MTAAAEALVRLTTPRVDARRAERRKLTLATLDDLFGEVDRVEQASRPGAEGLRVTGNWSAGQIMAHLARLVERSLDGFGAPPASERPSPSGLRALAARAELAAEVAAERHLRAALLSGTMQPGGPGVALPGELDPPVQVWTIDGAARLRNALERLRHRHPMDKPSPTIGRLSDAEWTTIHLRHAELHLSFIILGQSR